MDNQYQDQMLERAGALEQTVNTKGFELIKAYIENYVKSFSQEAVQTGFKSLDEYQFKRGRVAGLLDLLANIQSDLDGLQKYREEQRATSTTTKSE